MKKKLKLHIKSSTRYEAKTGIYVKKLSSSNNSHRKKALLRLLSLDPYFLEEYSETTGSLYIHKDLIFLVAEGQKNILIKFLEEEENRIKVHSFGKMNKLHSFYLKFDDIGMIKPEFGILRRDEWRLIFHCEGFKNLPDPRINLFCLKIKEGGFRIENESPIDVVGKKIAFSDMKTKVRNKSSKRKNLNLTSIENIENLGTSVGGGKRFRIKGNGYGRASSDHHQRNQKESLETRESSQSGKKYIFKENKKNSEKRKKIKNIFSLLDKRTDEKILKMNQMAEGYLTPRYQFRKKSQNKKWRPSSKFRISRSRKRRREKSQQVQDKKEENMQKRRDLNFYGRRRKSDGERVFTIRSASTKMKNRIKSRDLF